MKQNKPILPAIGAATGMLTLILDAKTGLRGAAEGVQLCINTVIPALFPFFLVSIFLTSTVTGLSVFRPIGKLLKLPKGGETYLLMGFLGGYPVGARCIAQGYQDGVLAAEDAERMLGFCSNAGPSFLFGMGSCVFPKLWMCWVVWLIHILSALFVGLTTPAPRSGTTTPVSSHKVSLAEAMKQAISAIASVCGWVIIMKVVLTFLQRWFLWLFSTETQILLSGLLELTNGTCALGEISSIGLRFVLFSVFLSFGGLCVLLQTHSVLQGSGLTGSRYFPGKVTQAAVSCLLSTAVLPLVGDSSWTPKLGITLTAVMIVSSHLILSVKSQKSSSIPKHAGV